MIPKFSLHRLKNAVQKQQAETRRAIKNVMFLERLQSQIAKQQKKRNNFIDDEEYGVQFFIQLLYRDVSLRWYGGENMIPYYPNRESLTDAIISRGSESQKKKGKEISNEFDFGYLNSDNIIYELHEMCEFYNTSDGSFRLYLREYSLFGNYPSYISVKMKVKTPRNVLLKFEKDNKPLKTVKFLYSEPGNLISMMDTISIDDHSLNANIVDDYKIEMDLDVLWAIYLGVPPNFRLQTVSFLIEEDEFSVTPIILE